MDSTASAKAVTLASGYGGCGGGSGWQAVGYFQLFPPAQTVTPAAAAAVATAAAV